MEDGEFSVGQVEFEVLETQPSEDRRQLINVLKEVRAKAMDFGFLSLFVLGSFSLSKSYSHFFLNLRICLF